MRDRAGSGPVLAFCLRVTRTPPAPTPSGPRPDEPSQVERLTGHGAVYRNGLKVLETGYELTITPQSLRGVTFEPGNEPKGSPDITGRLLGPLFESEPLQGVHTLVLEDGRAFDFRVIQPDTNEIVGVSWFDDPQKRR
jgi:hypothetical protein